MSKMWQRPEHYEHERGDEAEMSVTARVYTCDHVDTLEARWPAVRVPCGKCIHYLLSVVIVVVIFLMNGMGQEKDAEIDDD